MALAGPRRPWLNSVGAQAPLARPLRTDGLPAVTRIDSRRKFATANPSCGGPWLLMAGCKSDNYDYIQRSLWLRKPGSTAMNANAQPRESTLHCALS